MKKNNSLRIDKNIEMHINRKRAIQALFPFPPSYLQHQFNDWQSPFNMGDKGHLPGNSNPVRIEPSAHSPLF